MKKLPLKKNAPKASTTDGSKLSQLSRGLLILNIQREIEESAYTAMDRISKERKVVSRRQEYASDLERVIDETKLTLHLLANVQEQEKVGEKVHPPEEVISYYNGIFLDQVHQIKDKLFRMVDRILLVPDTAQDNQKKDPKKLEYSAFMKKNEETLKEAGIYDLLSEWGNGELGKALNKRTNHHHFVSTLRLNEDFQKIKMSRMMLNPLTSNQLSEYGKKRMAEIGEESFNKWRDDLVNKLQNTIEVMEKNVEQTAEKLIAHYKIPSKPEEMADTVNRYTQFLSTFDIKNQASKEKIPADMKPLIDGLKGMADLAFRGIKVSSAYLVGSVPRGEFIQGSSDINMYFIIDEDIDLTKHINKVPLLQSTFMTKSAFLSDAHKKERFICWSDGILLFGEEIKFDEKEFPRPGTFLSLLLNRGFIEELEKIKTEVAALSNPIPDVLRQYSLKSVKLMLDFDFGVSMANKPFYTASRSGKIKYTKESWPTERRTTTFEQIYHKGIIRQEDFPMVIDTFLENARKNFDKMLEVEAEISKDERM